MNHRLIVLVLSALVGPISKRPLLVAEQGDVEPLLGELKGAPRPDTGLRGEKDCRSFNLEGQWRALDERPDRVGRSRECPGDYPMPSHSILEFEDAPGVNAFFVEKIDGLRIAPANSRPFPAVSSSGGLMSPRR